MPTPKKEQGGKTRTVALNKLLNEHELQAVTCILNLSADDQVCAARLKAYFNGIKAKLLKLGVHSDYLAYVIVAQRGTILRTTMFNDN